jgi:hypothetical protein
MAAKGADLPYGLVSVANQRRPPVLCRYFRCSSIRASAARSSSCTTDAGTIRPAATSASLRARAASSSASLGMGGARSAGCLWCGVSSMGERIGGIGGEFQHHAVGTLAACRPTSCVRAKPRAVRVVRARRPLVLTPRGWRRRHRASPPRSSAARHRARRPARPMRPSAAAPAHLRASWQRCPSARPRGRGR